MRRSHLSGLSVGLLSIVLIGWVVAQMSATTGDYWLSGDLGGDDAAQPIMAIVHGHFGRLPSLQTVMGLVSILYRVPFVAVSTALGANSHYGFKVGAVACLLPIAGLVAMIASRARTPLELGYAVLGAMAMIIGPATALTICQGHPEDVLTVMLVTIAALAARREKRTWAAVTLGLGIGAKEWALVAVPVVLVAVPAGRRRVLAIAASIAVATTAPLALLDPSAFHHADASIGAIRNVSPLSLWWPVSSMDHRLPLGLARTPAFGLALVIAAAIVVGAGRWLRRRAGTAAPIDVMALLALACTVRCLCDPTDLGYYLVAVTIPLSVWEVGTLRRLPVVSLLVWGVQALCLTGAIPFGVAAGPLDNRLGVTAVLVGGVVLAGYLTLRTFVPVTAADGESLPEGLARPGDPRRRQAPALVSA